LFDRSEVVKASNEYFLDCETVILPGEGVRFTPKYYKGKFNLHQRAYALKDFSCSGLFLYYAIYAKKDLLATKAVQSTVLSLRLPILQNFEICIPVDIAEQAMKNADVVPIIIPIRGGTDGSKISYMGIPTPNIFVGGENFHGQYEFSCLEHMKKASDVIVEIAKLAKK